MFKFFILVFYFFLSTVSSEAQFSKNQLDLKCVGLRTFYNSEEIATATGFVVEYKQSFYLVTNYHVLAGKEQYDTTVFFSSDRVVPNYVEIYLYSADRESYTKCRVQLISNNKRTFFTWGPIPNSSGTIDVAILPISIPKNSFVDPIHFSSIDTLWVIRHHTKLFIYGHKGGFDPGKIRPSVDSLVSTGIVGDATYRYSSTQILGSRYADLSGCSGSPIYMIRNHKYIFIGIYSQLVDQIHRNDIKAGLSSWTIVGLFRFMSDLQHGKR